VVFRDAVLNADIAILVARGQLMNSDISRVEATDLAAQKEATLTSTAQSSYFFM